MASAAPQTSPLENHLICPICKETFREPVTTTCGHSFCKTCLQCSLEYSSMNCPLCNRFQGQLPNVNITLRDLVDQSQSENAERFQAGPGEVACDLCSAPRRRAEKSCLVCLTSYCSGHLERHRSTARLSGHKLVPPVENLDQRACSTHGRPLELYSRDQRRTLCTLCINGQEQVVSIEEESESKKAKVQETKMSLQRKIDTRRSKVDDINESLRRCRDRLDSEGCEIDAVFSAVLSVVEEAQMKATQPVRKRRETLEREARELTERLQAEIQTMEEAINDLNRQSNTEDHISFVQSFTNLENLENMAETVDEHLDTSLDFGTMRKITSNLLVDIQKKLENLSAIELERVPRFSVDVQLDPATAHRRLVVSDDGKEVRDSGADQDVDDSPERFDVFSSVMGRNRLNAGRAYWEVEVGEKTGWDLGVASVNARRKGKLTLSPANGYWMVVHYDGEHHAVMTDPPALLELQRKPERVGVFVDRDEGLVSFYDVTARSHIYSFDQCTFQDELVPYFSSHLKNELNADPLIILHSDR